jgi:hypothetical protein
MRCDESRDIREASFESGGERRGVKRKAPKGKKRKKQMALKR